jgi:hypothetical protein
MHLQFKSKDVSVQQFYDRYSDPSEEAMSNREKVTVTAVLNMWKSQVASNSVLTQLLKIQKHMRCAQIALSKHKHYSNFSPTFQQFLQILHFSDARTKKIREKLSLICSNKDKKQIKAVDIFNVESLCQAFQTVQLKKIYALNDKLVVQIPTPDHPESMRKVKLGKLPVDQRIQPLREKLASAQPENSRASLEKDKWGPGSRLYLFPNLLLFSDLQSISLPGHRLRMLPENMDMLTNLTSLDLRKNRFAEFPPQLFSLTTLEQLNLSHNRIRIIPREISRLAHLVGLRLQYNPITFISEELSQIKTLTPIDANFSQLLFPPISLISSYYSTSEDSYPYWELKLFELPHSSDETLQFQESNRLYCDPTVEPCTPLSIFLKAIITGTPEQVVNAFSALDPYYSHQMHTLFSLSNPLAPPTSSSQSSSSSSSSSSSQDIGIWNLEVDPTGQLLLIKPNGEFFNKDVRTFLAKTIRRFVASEYGYLSPPIQLKLWQLAKEHSIDLGRDNLRVNIFQFLDAFVEVLHSPTSSKSSSTEMPVERTARTSSPKTDLEKLIEFSKLMRSDSIWAQEDLNEAFNSLSTAVTSKLFQLIWMNEGCSEKTDKIIINLCPATTAWISPNGGNLVEQLIYATQQQVMVDDLQQKSTLLTNFYNGITDLDVHDEESRRNIQALPEDLRDNVLQLLASHHIDINSKFLNASLQPKHIRHALTKLIHKIEKQEAVLIKPLKKQINHEKLLILKALLLDPKVSDQQLSTVLKLLNFSKGWRCKCKLFEISLRLHSSSLKKANGPDYKKRIEENIDNNPRLLTRTKDADGVMLIDLAIRDLVHS